MTQSEKTLWVILLFIHLPPRRITPSASASVGAQCAGDVREERPPTYSSEEYQ
jgi:hypothetical protein